MQNPDVQLKAQAEIDDNVGSDRLPTLSDRHRLPYLDALISETLRYSVIAPLGASHTAKTDGSYNGYLIPKGSRVTVNAWYVLGIFYVAL
jgi:cytochrome P450